MSGTGCCSAPKCISPTVSARGLSRLPQHGESGFDRNRIQLIANELASDLRTLGVECASIIAIGQPMHASTVSALYDCVYDFAFFAYTDRASCPYVPPERP